MFLQLVTISNILQLPSRVRAQLRVKPDFNLVYSKAVSDWRQPFQTSSGHHYQTKKMKAEAKI